jgi:hypothetical protein
LSSLKGFSFDTEKLDMLLGLFENGQMSLEQAQELKLLLEPLHRKALELGDLKTARKIRNILMSLRGFLSGRISLVESVPISGYVDIKKIQSQ